MILISIKTRNQNFKDYNLKKVSNPIGAHPLAVFPPDNLPKVKETLSIIFQIVTGQLPDTMAILYLKEIEGFHLRPTLTEYINTICKEILTNGRESVYIRFSNKQAMIEADIKSKDFSSSFLDPNLLKRP